MGAAVASVLLRPTFFMLVAFVVTFLVTRLVTHMIRTGRGPFRDNTVGGVHIHHEVYGIFLLLGAGALEFAYQPAPPGPQILATLFGVGAALTLDEFALWLHLDDVYWGPEGRRSVDAVLVAVIVGGLMLVEAAPWDVDASDGATVVGVTLGVNLLFIVIALFKGRIILGILGFLVPLLAFVAALRLARPRSPWARRYYGAGTRRRARSERRFPAGRHHRWDKVVDMFAGSPALPAPAPASPGAAHCDERPVRLNLSGRRRGKLPGMADGTTGGTSGARRLVLLRHAKSAWPDGVPDSQRPLNGRGRRDARAAGQWLREHVDGLGAVVCSPAQRTRETWAIVSAELDGPPSVRLDDRVYGAPPERPAGRRPRASRTTPGRHC